MYISDDNNKIDSKSAIIKSYHSEQYSNVLTCSI